VASTSQRQINWPLMGRAHGHMAHRIADVKDAKMPKSFFGHTPLQTVHFASSEYHNVP